MQNKYHGSERLNPVILKSHPKLESSKTNRKTPKGSQLSLSGGSFFEHLQDW